MTRTHKVKTRLQLDVPKFGSREEFIVIVPQVIEVKWTRNNHLVADELTVTIGWKEGGVDPRAIKNARGALWMWDSNDEDYDEDKHLRFTGICVKAQRKIHETGWAVDITFHDYTTLFIHNKPLKSSGMPTYSDTLAQIWDRICENTGWQDPYNDKILSSVEAFREDGHLVFTKPEFGSRTLGELVPDRFRKVGKPTPKRGAGSWDVWQWCIGSLGLISYIDRDKCIVTDTTEHYAKEDAARAVYGQNIHTLEEEVDASITSKGILLKSMDPLTWQVLEAFYPPPGDERLRTRRSAVRPKSEGGASVTANEVSGEYEEYNRYDITDQTALERAAREAYEERSRQEIEGSFKTAELTLYTLDGVPVSIWDLRAGDAIRVETEPGLRDLLEDIAGSATWGDGSAHQIRYLVDQVGYDEDVARLIVSNLKVDELRSPIFHIKTLEFELGPERFEIEVKFHNLVVIST